MHRTTCLRRALGGAATLLALAGASPAAAATGTGADDATDAVEQCTVDAVDVLATGELVLGEMTCVTVDATAARSGPAPLAALAGPVAIHYDGANLTGASLQINLSCGTWANLTTTWRNRVSSTWTSCASVTHWSGLNLTGTSQSTFNPWGNLTTLNNLADSASYN